MKILIDAMGGDNAPLAPVQGALEAAKLWDVEIVLVGREDEILAAAKESGYETLPANVQALRDKVEANMRAQGSTFWRVSQVLYHDCSCALAVCHGAFYPEKIYQGIPYNHKASSLDRFLYCFDEEGVAKDWVYDMPAFEGHDMYMGNDCSTSIQKAYLTVSNSITFSGASKTRNCVGNFIFNFNNF